MYEVLSFSYKGREYVLGRDWAPALTELSKKEGISLEQGTVDDKRKILDFALLERLLLGNDLPATLSEFTFTKGKWGTKKKKEIPALKWVTSQERSNRIREFIEVKLQMGSRVTPALIDRHFGGTGLAVSTLNNHIRKVRRTIAERGGNS